MFLSKNRQFHILTILRLYGGNKISYSKKKKNLIQTIHLEENHLLFLNLISSEKSIELLKLYIKKFTGLLLSEKLPSSERMDRDIFRQ